MTKIWPEYVTQAFFAPPPQKLSAQMPLGDRVKSINLFARRWVLGILSPSGTHRAYYFYHLFLTLLLLLSEYMHFRVRQFKNFLVQFQLCLHGINSQPIYPVQMVRLLLSYIELFLSWNKVLLYAKNYTSMKSNLPIKIICDG